MQKFNSTPDYFNLREFFFKIRKKYKILFFWNYCNEEELVVIIFCFECKIWWLFIEATCWFQRFFKRRYKIFKKFDFVHRLQNFKSLFFKLPITKIWPHLIIKVWRALKILAFWTGLRFNYWVYEGNWNFKADSRLSLYTKIRSKCQKRKFKKTVPKFVSLPREQFWTPIHNGFNWTPNPQIVSKRIGFKNVMTNAQWGNWKKRISFISFIGNFLSYSLIRSILLSK